MIGWIKRLFGNGKRAASPVPSSPSVAIPTNAIATPSTPAPRIQPTPQNEQPSAMPTKTTPIPSWLAKIPQRVAFVDVETTGLTEQDRVVSFAGILLETAELADEIFRLKCIHLICDPGRKSHPRAEAVHGYTDWVLRHQEPFSENANAAIEILNQADLIVAHNLAFDISFINREFCAAGSPALEKPTYCTMQAYRQRGLGRAGLDAVAARIGFSRSGTQHSALEDAWLAMVIFLWLHDCPSRFPFSAFGDAAPKNMKPVPPMPAGPLPRRKKAALTESNVQQPGRRYSDDNVKAAWELFEDKDYGSALDRAMAAITRDEARESGSPDSAPYEIACMILRRQARLAEEQDLLWRFFHQQLGPDVSREQILALAVPPWGDTATTRVMLIGNDENRSYTPGQRPRPATWEMAARFAHVMERLEKKPETNEERFARALSALPNEHAFKEAAVCIRKIIAEAIKKRNDSCEELLRLHRIAQQHAFLYGVYRLGWDHPENKIDSRAGLYPHVAAEMATEADLEAVIGPYREVGYQYLPLLNKTDIKRLVTAFGEPSGHVMRRERNKKIWERYRKEARRLKREMFAHTPVGDL